MARKVYHLPPCPEYDVEKLESWLQDMAKEGLVLEPEGEAFGFFGFTPGRPQVLRYRLQPKPHGEQGDIVPAQEARELASQFGWEFVDDYRYFYIYRTTDPTAREMDTDYAVQATALKVVRKGISTNLFSQLFTLLAILYMQDNLGPIRFFVSVHPIITVSLVLFPVFLLASLLRKALYIRALERKLKAHTPLAHDTPWQPKALWHRLCRLGSVGMTVAVIVSFCTFLLSLQKQPLTQYPGDAPFVTLEDMAETYEPQELFDYYGSYEAISSPLAQVVSWREYADITLDGQAYSGAILLVNYCDTASPWLAEQLSRELVNDAKAGRYYSEMEAPDLDVDYCTAWQDIYPTILLRQGSLVIQATVNIRSEEAGDRFLDWVLQQSERMKQ